MKRMMTKSAVWIGLVFLLGSCLKTEEVISPLEQLNLDVATIDNYLAENGIIALKDASGIRVEIIQLGDGNLPPNLDNNINVKYTGKLLSNGSIFDSNTTTGITGRLSSYILGWQIGLGLLPEGSVAKLYIPSGYAYGTSGAGSIPPNAILVFDLELVSVSPTQTQVDKLASDKQLIDDYLLEKEISAIEHESGIRYTITEGAGTVSPTLYDEVEIVYTGKLLSDGSVFYSQTLKPSDEFSSRVINFPHGVIIGLQLMKEGDKMTIYTPSTLAYGTRSISGVPSNSNVIFEIELLEVNP